MNVLAKLHAYPSQPSSSNPPRRCGAFTIKLVVVAGLFRKTAGAPAATADEAAPAHNRHSARMGVMQVLLSRDFIFFASSGQLTTWWLSVKKQNRARECFSKSHFVVQRQP